MNEGAGGAPAKKDETSSSLRNRIGAGVLGAAFAFLAGAIIVAMRSETKSLADPENTQQVTRGKFVYVQNCMVCHGDRLQGQPNWQDRLPTGRMPAPPHDASGHTWHHPDAMLFGMTKFGLIPGKYAPPGYQSDMPAFSGVLADEEIWAVLAYIKSSWPKGILRAQGEVTLEQGRR